MIVKRIGIAIGLLNLKVAEVARRTGINYDTCYQVLSGRGKVMRTDILEAFIAAFPEMSADYILRGEGEPLRNAPTVAPTINHLIDALIKVRDITDQLSQSPYDKPVKISNYDQISLHFMQEEISDITIALRNHIGKFGSSYYYRLPGILTLPFTSKRNSVSYYLSFEYEAENQEVIAFRYLHNHEVKRKRKS